jgi:hypothetical protein
LRVFDDWLFIVAADERCEEAGLRGKKFRKRLTKRLFEVK